MNNNQNSPLIFPQIMGILNVTPDSFSDGGNYNEANKAIEHALEMIDQGADIIDIGGESTRPGAPEISAEEENKRVMPIIEGIRKHNKSITLSIDTTKYDVSKAAIDAGVDIINDISGLSFEPEIAELVAKQNKALVIMHLKGTPRTMQENPQYCDLTNEIYLDLQNKIKFATEKGVKNIIADVGIGFGKTVEHNWQLLKFHHIFESLGVPLLLGISRKSFIGKTFGIDNASDRDYETAIIHALMKNKRIDIIRVHNVAMLNRVRQIATYLN